MNHNSLFEGQLVCLAPFDPDKDAETEARWTHNTDYMRQTFFEPLRPLSVAQVKKKYEEAHKKEERNFRFAIRTRADDRLIGFVALEWIEWVHGVARFQFGIAEAADRGQGYGAEAVRLMLNYSFNELNLYRLAASVGSYNTGAIRFLERLGFQQEVRRREAIQRDGQYWDDVLYALLRDEWKPTAG